MKSYDVKFWAIRPGKAKTKRTYEIRWKVGPTPHSRTLGNKAQADSFLSDLRQAARNGEAFDTDTGLPDSMTKATSRERSWLDFCLAYVDMKWPSAAPKTRDALTDALAAIIPAVVGEQAPDGMDRRDPTRRPAAFRAGPGFPRAGPPARRSQRRCAGWRRPRCRSARSASPSTPGPSSTRSR